ncbi:MAG: OB-fold nucleic acid binding domain-containing protein, partial [Candidatus Thermoplasmatota archaeon]
MTTIDEAVKRTVRRFSEKGITLEEKEIGKRLNKLTVFGVPVAEAERTIAAAVARENGITLYDGQHTGASVRDIRDLAVEEWATIEGRVVSLSVPQSPGIHSQGIIADRTGAIQFTAWNRKRDTDTMIPDIQVGKWYRFSNGVIRDYKGCPVYNIHSGSDVVELDDMGNIPEIVTPIGKMSVGVVTIKGKVTRIFPPKSEKVKQRGVIGDATGTTLYTIWVSDAPEFVLEEGQSYV